jgi:uncharacterized protein
MIEEVREFQIFVKPVGAHCNLNCSYCYYLGKRSLYPGKHKVIMDIDTLEKYVIQHIKATSDRVINFSWHGGEPLLAGIDFYKSVILLQKKHKPAGSEITNGIQTNGTLLNDEWCDFLALENFVVGISIDGPGDLHNSNRRTIDDNNTFLNVLRGFELLKMRGVLPEILCVVNAQNVKYPLEVYSLFKELGAKYISFLPLVEPEPGSPAGASKNSVPPLDFGVFLSTVFDEWVERDIGEIKIQIFEEAARTAFNQEHTLCIFKKNCGGVPVVEHTGDFYSCDHYVNPSHMLGNIKDHSLTYYLDSKEQKAFGMAKSLTLPEYCKVCEVRSMCNGECPKNRFIKAPDGEAGLNYLCDGYKYFFNHCRPFVEAIAEAWKNNMGL